MTTRTRCAPTFPSHWLTATGSISERGPGSRCGTPERSAVPERSATEGYPRCSPFGRRSPAGNADMLRPMSGHRGLRLVFSLLLLASLALFTPTADASPQRWVASWAASPVVGSVIPWSDCPAGDGLTDQTVRNVVFVSAGGSQVRVRLTNAFGTTPLRVGHASVAVQSSGADAVAGTVRELRFRGHRGVTIPAGHELFSDPVPLRVAALSTLLVSTYVPGPTGPLTNHPFTAQGNFLAAGARAVDVAGPGYGGTPCWMVADGVDVAPARQVIGSVVALGDSITDTSATTGNANHRWP